MEMDVWGVSPELVVATISIDFLEIYRNTPIMRQNLNACRSVSMTP